jgi:hypothetical protein
MLTDLAVAWRQIIVFEIVMTHIYRRIHTTNNQNTILYKMTNVTFTETHDCCTENRHPMTTVITSIARHIARIYIRSRECEHPCCMIGSQFSRPLSLL